MAGRAPQPKKPPRGKPDSTSWWGAGTSFPTVKKDYGTTRPQRGSSGDALYGRTAERTTTNRAGTTSQTNIRNGVSANGGVPAKKTGGAKPRPTKAQAAASARYAGQATAAAKAAAAKKFAAAKKAAVRNAEKARGMNAANASAKKPPKGKHNGFAYNGDQKTTMNITRQQYTNPRRATKKK